MVLLRPQAARATLLRVPADAVLHLHRLEHPRHNAIARIDSIAEPGGHGVPEHGRVNGALCEALNSIPLCVAQPHFDSPLRARSSSAGVNSAPPRTPSQHANAARRRALGPRLRHVEPPIAPWTRRRQAGPAARWMAPMALHESGDRARAGKGASW